MDELEGGGFLELLSSGDADEAGFLLGCEPPCLSSACSATGCHMLCFGAGAAAPPPQVSSESSLSSLSSSPPTSTTTSTVTTNSSKASKVGVSGGLNDISSKKKARTGASASQPGTMRVRKEKLGERIVALQQLVSPFGKSDTASVLHEALGYIRFLHDQVQVLSSPYLQRLPTPAHLHDGGGDLRSRGLCLVPVSCTEHVAKSNGADIWSPSSMGSSSNSSASKH